MTTGIKKAITIIKRQQGVLGYELFLNVYYDVATDHVFATGSNDDKLIARILEDAESFDPTPVCESVDEYIRWNYFCELDDVKTLAKRLETSIVVSRDIYSDDHPDFLPSMWSIKRDLLRIGADIMRESYQAGVPVEHIIA